MTAQLLTGLPRAMDANGNTLPGAKLYLYATGTTTLQTGYADSGLTTPLANPVIADAGGMFAAIYLDPAKVYRARLTDYLGSVISDTDPTVTDTNLSACVSAASTPNGSTSASISFLPNGNPVTSRGGAVFQYVTNQADQREIAAAFGMQSTMGDANTNPGAGNGDKIGLYVGAYGAAHTYNIFGINTTTTAGPGATSIQGAWGYEMDFVNQCQNTGGTSGPTGLAAPIYKGFDAVHNGTYYSSTAFITTALSTGLWNRGYTATGVYGEAFADYSNALISFNVYGTHTDILNATNASVSGMFLRSPSDRVTVDGAGRSKFTLNVNPYGTITSFAMAVHNGINASTENGLRVSNTWRTNATTVLWVGSDNSGASPQTQAFLEVLGDGSIYMRQLQASTSYANDAAASAGGVSVGQLYRNGSVIQLRIA